MFFQKNKKLKEKQNKIYCLTNLITYVHRRIENDNTYIYIQQQFMKVSVRSLASIVKIDICLSALGYIYSCSQPIPSLKY